MNLYEWTKQYIRFQDSVRKQIVNIKETAQGYQVEEKTTQKEYNVYPKLAEYEFIPTKNKLYIITANNKTNLQYLIKNWKKTLESPQLTILFVNPKTNEKWHVQPIHHQKISEKLEPSLSVLFENCSTYTE